MLLRQLLLNEYVRKINYDAAPNKKQMTAPFLRDKQVMKCFFLNGFMNLRLAQQQFHAGPGKEEIYE